MFCAYKHQDQRRVTSDAYELLGIAQTHLIEDFETRHDLKRNKTLDSEFLTVFFSIILSPNHLQGKYFVEEALRSKLEENIIQIVV